MDPNSFKNRPVVICHLCGKTFARKFNLRRHELSIHNISIHNVDHVGDIAETSQVTNVNQKLTKDKAVFICYLCGKLFGKKSNLYRHESAVHNIANRNVDHIESIPDKTSSIEIEKSQESCQNRKLTKDKAVFICYLCGKTFGKRSNLYRHESAVHNVATRNVDHIENIPDEPRLIEAETSRERNQTKNNAVFACDKCDKVFPTSKALVRHIRLRHTVPLVCFQCNKTFATNWNLRRHTKTGVCLRDFRNPARNDNAVNCNFCDKSFTNKWTLGRHTRAFHEADITEYLEHSNRYHCENESCKSKKFKCVMCPRRFRSEDNLAHHEHKEHNMSCSIEYYKCNDCPIEYRSKWEIRRHIEAYHTDAVDKRLIHGCSICDAQFPNRAVLTQHFQQMHSIQLEFEYLNFASLVEAERSMDSIHHNFFNENNWKTSVDIVRRYRCHRSGNYIDKCEKKSSKRKRRLKVGGTKKLQSFCPAEYTIRESLCDKSCTVILQNVHVGHDIHDVKELQFTRLSKAEKQDIAKKLILGEPENSILNNIHQDGNPSRFNLTNKQDIRNIARKISHYTLDNDIVQVESLIHENEGD